RVAPHDANRSALGMHHRTDDLISTFVRPESDTSEESRDVGRDLDVLRQRDFQVLRVAAAQVDAARIPDRVDLPEDLVDPLVPFLLAHPVERTRAHVLLVRLSLAERMVRELEVRNVATVQVQSPAHSGSWRDPHPDAGAFHP